MPRFFFHLRRDGVLERDPEGVECPTSFAARREAVMTARVMISNDALAGRDPIRYVFEIESEGGETIARVHFSQAIEPAQPSRGRGVDSIGPRG
jgi:hypothetical protein